MVLGRVLSRIPNAVSNHYIKNDLFFGFTTSQANFENSRNESDQKLSQSTNETVLQVKIETEICIGDGSGEDLGLSHAQKVRSSLSGSYGESQKSVRLQFSNIWIRL